MVKLPNDFTTQMAATLDNENEVAIPNDYPASNAN